MAKYDEQLSRMEYLMNYNNSLNESKSNNGIEYHTEGSDGKVYGIIRENNKYYIKTTQKGKENLKESYDYINGYNYRNENGYNSYNEATKQLEIKLMNINEATGIHKDVSTVDFNRGEKVLANLTEEARKEIDRVNQIMENMGIKSNIGDHGNPEGKGTSTGANTKENNKPFDTAADNVQPEKDITAKATDPKKVGGFKTVSNAENQLQNADKMARGNRGDEEYEIVDDDLDGESVATQRPKGAKAVKMNESEQELDDDMLDEFEMDDDEDVCEEGKHCSLDEDEDIDLEISDDSMLSEDDIIFGDNPVLPGKNGHIKPKKQVLTWDKMNEGRINEITDMVCESILGSKRKPVNESLQDKITRMVKEEVTRLDAWGKHPKYGKEPMTVPQNKEKIVNPGDRDFNDASAKGNERYGKRIGSSAPFVNDVEVLTDAVVQMVKENLKKKSKKVGRY